MRQARNFVRLFARRNIYLPIVWNACYRSSVRDLNGSNFAIAIAYLVPGFMVLVGLGWHSPVIAGWLGAAPTDSPTVSGFLFVTIASIAAGMVTNAVRWVCLDWSFSLSGVPERNWNYARLQECFEAYQFLVTNQFRYYQSFGNLLVAIVILSFCSWFGGRQASATEIVGTVALEGILWWAARDALTNYVTRGGELLGTREAAGQGNAGSGNENRLDASS